MQVVRLLDPTVHRRKITLPHLRKKLGHGCKMRSTIPKSKHMTSYSFEESASNRRSMKSDRCPARESRRNGDANDPFGDQFGASGAAFTPLPSSSLPLVCIDVVCKFLIAA